MRYYYLCAVVLALLLTLALGGSIFAESGSVVYRKFYDIDGIILMKIQAGSDYNDTGQHKTLIQGAGSLTRDEMVILGRGKIAAENENIWIADPDSLLGLKVVSTFRLHDQESDDISGDQENVEEPEQIFAVSVKANPGEEGGLSQNISAASAVYGEEDELFSISQSAATSGGTVKRYIDITEPVSGDYLFEDSEIKGRVNISEVLQFSDAGDNEQSTEELTGGEMTGDEGELPEAQQTVSSENPADDDVVLIIDGSEIFNSVVPLGTTVEDIGLLEELAFNSDLITVDDIYVEWDDRLFEAYDPHQIGSYTFEGRLIFPDNIISEHEVYIYHVVNVVDQDEYEKYLQEIQ